VADLAFLPHLDGFTVEPECVGPEAIVIGMELDDGDAGEGITMRLGGRPGGGVVEVRNVAPPLARPNRHRCRLHADHGQLGPGTGSSHPCRGWAYRRYAHRRARGMLQRRLERRPGLQLASWASVLAPTSAPARRVATGADDGRSSIRWTGGDVNPPATIEE
jgi:hypothetical protein